MGNFIVDTGGRSFELGNVINIVKKLQKKNYAVIYMGEIPIDFQAEGCTQVVASPRGIDLRQWGAIVQESDLLLGCDSVGQHLAYSNDTPAVVVVGSTCKENISYPNCEKFEVLDMGEGLRIYDPIRITMDEVTQRVNDGIMNMNDKIENVVIESVEKQMKKFFVKKNENIVLPTQNYGPSGCDIPNQQMQQSIPNVALPESMMQKSAVEQLMESSKNGNSNSKKPSGFLDTVKK